MSKTKTMRALSVKQPWAFWIATGQKTVEMRSWKTDYRGPILICASAQRDGDFDKLDPEYFPLGCAICVVTLTDIVPMTAAMADAAMPYDDNSDCKDEDFPGYGWFLSEPKVICPPFPVKGKLHFYDVEIPPETEIIPSDDYFIFEDEKEN